MTDVVIVSETEIVAVDDTVSSGAPSGPAGGVLGGTYPNPSFAADMATQAELDAHVNDTSAAHAASAVSYAGGTGMSATDVEAALDELATEKQNAASVAADSGVTAHLADTVDAHDASAISFSPTGTVAATDVQAAIAEVAAEAGSGTGTALTQSIAQTAHGLVVSNVVRFNGTNYVKAQADSATNAEVIGIVSAVADANNFTLLTDGKITGLSGLTAGAVYFLSPSTAGLLTLTEPTTVGQVSKPVLIAASTTAGVFFNLRGILIGADPATLGSTYAVFSRSGALDVAAGAGRFPAPEAATIIGVRAAVGTAPTGASILVDVNKNGTTVFTTQGDRPSIAAAATSSAEAVPAVTSVAAGDLLSVDVDQVGSSVAGSDLTVVVLLRVALS